jgi:hypothetical protein
MPFDDIVWHGFMGGSYAERGSSESSNAIDVRFGQTESEDSHSTFSWPGNRRYCMSIYEAVITRLQHWPYSDGLYLRQDRNNVTYNQADAWSVGDTADWSIGVYETTIFGFPGVAANAAQGYSANFYSTAAVDDMTVNNSLTANAGYPANQRDDLSSGDNHSTLNDHLFQAQNREGCHQLSTSVNVRNIDNPFIGIHESFPLKITTTQSYNGYRLVLKRKRFRYNQDELHLASGQNGLPRWSLDFLEPFELGRYDSWQAPWLFIGNQWNNIEIGSTEFTTKTHNNGTPTVNGKIGSLFNTRFPWPKNANNAATTNNAISSAGSSSLWYNDPGWFSENGWAPGRKGTQWNNEISVSEACIHRTIVPRQQMDTGSVNIKSITIKKNDTVLKAEDDVIGPWVEVRRDQIYDLGKANTSGATLTFASMYSGIRNTATTGVNRYLAVGFQIKFENDSAWYSITAVSAANATISPPPSSNKANVEFTLRIPRGSTDTNYTWGNYKLTVFDEDNFDNTACARITFEHLGSELTRYARETTPLGYDLFQFTRDDNTNGNRTVQGVHNLTFFNPDFPNAKTGRPVRHPHFGNELGESLSLRNDYGMNAFWDRFRLGTPNSALGHISTDIGAQDISWSACNWVTYYELERARSGTGDGSNTGFTNMKQIQMDLSDLGFKATEVEKFQQIGSLGNDGRLGGTGANADTYLDYQDIELSIRTFLFGGLDPVSGSIWPSYKVNLADFSPANFAQNFTGGSGQWTNFFNDAYGDNVTVAEHLDKAWYAFCAHEKDSALFQMYHDNYNGILSHQVVCAFTMQVKGNNGVDDNNNTLARRAFGREMEAKQVKTLLHPWVTASYGYDYDQLGWGGELTSTLFHAFTIYDSDEKISSGTTFEVSLHQAGIPFMEETLNIWDGLPLKPSHLLGLGPIMIPVDNYELVIVAK